MSDAPSEETEQADASSSASTGPNLSTREYLRLTVGNRISLLGLAVGVAGAVYIVLTSPDGLFPGGDPIVGAGLLLGGALVFALGFSYGQRTLSERDDW